MAPGFRSSTKMLWGILSEMWYFPLEMRSMFVLGTLFGFWYYGGPSSQHQVDVYSELRGATVVVTGASKGIGEETAYAFAKHGSRLLVTARNQDALHKVALKCKELGASQAYHISADMSKESDVEKVFRFVGEKFRNRLDFLVLNHALQVPVGVWEGTAANLSTLDYLWKINVRSQVQLTSLVLSDLKSSGGRIVAVSSIIGRSTVPYFAPYITSKFALEGFFGSLQHELKMENSSASVTIAVLGRIDTATQRELTKNAGFKRLDRLPGAQSVSGTAEALLEAALIRQRVLYHPKSNRLAVIASHIPFVSDLLFWAVGNQMERD